MVKACPQNRAGFLNGNYVKPQAFHVKQPTDPGPIFEPSMKKPMENNYTIASPDAIIDERTINQIEYQTDCINDLPNDNNIDYENSFGEFDCAGL